MREVALAQCRHGEQPVQQGVVRIVRMVEGAPVRRVVLHHAVAVELQGCHALRLWIEVEVVIHLAFVHVPIIIPEGDLAGQEPQGAVDVQVVLQGVGQRGQWCLLQLLAHTHQVIPGVRLFGALQGVVLLIGAGVRAQIVQRRGPIAPVRSTARSTAGAARCIGPPERAVVAEVPLLHIVVVQLLHVRVDPPTLAIDVQVNEVGFRCGDVVADQVEVHHFPQERRVLEGVVQVQGLVAHQVLPVDGMVHREVERLLLRGRWQLHVTGLPLEAHTHAVVRHAVHRQRRRDIRLAGVVLRHQRPVIGLRELQIHGADGLLGVKPRTGLTTREQQVVRRVEVHLCGQALGCTVQARKQSEHRRRDGGDAHPCGGVRLTFG